MNKVAVFEKEYQYIKNPKYVQNIKVIVGMLPDYFFEVPAASTGKYHPAFTQGEGGLVRHTKVAVRIAYELLYNNSIGNIFKNNEKDMLIMGILIHDGLKSGIEKSQYTKFEHPLLIAHFLRTNQDKFTLDEKEIEFIASAIESHMGEWNTNSYSSVVLPLPSNRYQKFVHMCDFLASRKFLDIKFDQDDIVD